MAQFAFHAHSGLTDFEITIDYQGKDDQRVRHADTSILILNFDFFGINNHKYFYDFLTRGDISPIVANVRRSSTISVLSRIDTPILLEELIYLQLEIRKAIQENGWAQKLFLWGQDYLGLVSIITAILDPHYLSGIIVLDPFNSAKITPATGSITWRERLKIARSYKRNLKSALRNADLLYVPTLILSSSSNPVVNLKDQGQIGNFIRQSQLNSNTRVEAYPLLPRRNETNFTVRDTSANLSLLDPKALATVDLSVINKFISQNRDYVV